MQKNIFHNDKAIENNSEVKEHFYLKNVKIKKSVDINNLLNRVKIDQQNEKKQQFIFFSLGVLLLGSVGIFVTIIK